PFSFAFSQGWAAGSATIGLSGAVSGLSANFTAGSSQLIHWSSVRPEMATTGTNSFPHFAQRVMRSITDTPTFALNSELEILFHSSVEVCNLPSPFRGVRSLAAGRA